MVKKEDNLLGKVFTFTLLYGSLYGTYIWTGKCFSVLFIPELTVKRVYNLVLSVWFISGLIPLCLALTNRDDLLRLRPGVFMILGWG